MSDTTPDANQQPPADGSNTPSDATDATSETVENPEKLLETLRKVRDERKQIEDQLREAREQLKGYETKDLTEQERITRERDEALAELEQLRRDAATATAQSALTAAATKAGAIDATIVARLALDDVEVKDGNVTGVEDAIKALKAAHPALFQPARPGTADAGKGKGTGPAESANDRFRRALRGG